VQEKIRAKIPARIYSLRMVTGCVPKTNRRRSRRREV